MRVDSTLRAVANSLLGPAGLKSLFLGIGLSQHRHAYSLSHWFAQGMLQ